MTKKEMEKELNWFKRWLVRQPRWLQISFCLIFCSLFGLDVFVLLDPLPFLDEVALGLLAWQSFKVTVDEGPRYRQLEAPAEEGLS